MSELKMDACPICSAPVSLWNSKTTEAGEFKLDRCQDCSYVFVNPRPSLEYLVDFYTNNTHDNSFRDEAEVSLSDILKKEADWPNSSVDAERIVGTAHSLVKTTSPEGALTLFDVACGFGFFTREAINLGFDVTALEISNSDRKIASDMNLSQIVEHVLDINEWIGKAQKLLKSDGLLAVALPNFDNLFRYILGKNEPYIIPPEHLNYFNGRNLQKLLSNHGLSVENIEWTSKVAPSEVRKLPLGKLAEPIFAPLVGISLNLIDLLHLGIFVTVYARKK
jgi:SAM-dependent methyltransferase